MTSKTKPFDLELAIAGHPLVTRDGQAAKFIAYVPDNQPTHQVIASINGLNSSFYIDGNFLEVDDSCSDLLLAPLGYCEDKPVFAGDELMCSGKKYTAVVTDRTFEFSTWPKPERTFSMTESEFVELAEEVYRNYYYHSVLSFNDHTKQILTEWLNKQKGN